ncbi:hypothetical protein [Microcella alkaliphila]|uniref:hypothetical protein n=1 Tax=Microcella alkaliphila TaxID=279828 RepID=UPI0010292E03|nr:hypothetical protein [Microcella alkaliphila]
MVARTVAPDGTATLALIGVATAVLDGTATLVRSAAATVGLVETAMHVRAVTVTQHRAGRAGSAARMLRVRGRDEHPNARRAEFVRGAPTQTRVARGTMIRRFRTT